MTTPTSFRSVKIKDNLIDIGSSSTNYFYSSCMSLGADALVTGNTFSGCVGNGVGSTNLTVITDGSSLISNNAFIRGVGSPINSYINVTSVNDQVITDNLFDQTTIDGTPSHDILVTGLSTGSVYHSNKNQTIYIPIQLATGAGTDPSGGRYFQDNVTDAYSDNGTIYVERASFGTNFTVFTDHKDLNSILPPGIRLHELKIGILAPFLGAGSVISATPSDNQFILTASSVDNVSTNYATGPNSILDVKYEFDLTSGGDFPPDFTVSTTYDVHGNFTAMRTATQYITLTLNDERFRNTKDRMLFLSADQFITLSNATGGGVLFRISPILAKCIW